MAAEAGYMHVKHKIPRKRASYLLGVIEKEATERRPLGFPDFKTGDAIECHMLPFITSPRVETVRGIVLGRYNKGIASSFLIRDVLFDEPIERRIPLYSPLLKKITVLKQRAIYEGKQEGKRVRPSKIYYLRKLDKKFSQVTGRVFTGIGKVDSGKGYHDVEPHPAPTNIKPSKKPVIIPSSQ